MEEKREKTLSEHREHFARFVGLLTGELGVEAVFGDEPGSKGHKRIVLPKIESLDSKRLDFLYALCLREAGLLSMSQRTVASIASHATQGELATSFAIESGRVERALMRKFAGASEILDQHWKREAADAELGPMAFGIDPSKASVDQVFPFVAKWALVGKPPFGWDKIFPQASWSRCVEAVEAEPMKSLIANSRLRKWEDARDLAGSLWEGWVAIQGGDATKKLTPSPKAKALAEAERTLREAIPEAISGLVQQRDEMAAKAKAAQERARQIMGDNQGRVDELNKSISALQKQLSPFEEVAERLEQARKLRQMAASARAAMETAKIELEGCKTEADGRKSSAEQTARERALKDGEKASEIEKRIGELEAERDQAEQDARQLPQEVADRIAQLEAKVGQARQEAEAKAEGLRSKMGQERAKADAAEGSQKQKLEQKVAELQAKLDQQRAKGLRQEQKAAERAQQARASAQEKAQDAANRAKSQLQELEERLKKAMQAAGERQERAQQKGSPTATLQRRAAQARAEMAHAAESARQADEKAQQEQANAATAAGKSKATVGMAEEDLLKKIEELEAALAKDAQEKEGLQAPAREAKQEARDALSHMREANEQASRQAHQEMQKLQDRLDAQGVPCDLVERMEEIEGWEEANQAQRDFDKLASEQTGESVINGSGGGAGSRDVMADIALKAQGIDEINPNEIFAGVEKLSPLSGFSEGGVDGGVGEVNTGVGSGSGFASAKPHLVWRKDRDKVIPAPKKDAIAIKALQTRYAPEIGEVKKVFAAKMKPSFKSRFRGGREEGQLDGRAIWKLAASQGDDFYEIDSKKPDNRASASILVDMSGSLSSLGAKASELLQACALMLSEGLSAVEIDHEILGHCAPFEPDFAEQKIPGTFNRKGCRLETVVVKNFGDKNKSGIASLEIQQADNSDGEAVRVAVSRLKKRQGKKKMLFIVSDGKPFMQDADIEILDEDLRRALTEAAAQKMIVVSVGFGPNGHPVMGSRHIGVEGLADLAKALEKHLEQ